MTDRIEDSTRLQPGPTRRAFLGAGALTLLGLAVPTVASIGVNGDVPIQIERDATGQVLRVGY